MNNMDGEIEKVPSVTSGEYEYLFKVDTKKVQNLTVEELLLKIAIAGGKLHFARKVAYLDSRVLLQIDQLRISNEKAAVYVQKNSLFIEGAAVVCHVTAAYFGGSTNFTGGALSALGQACTAGASYKDKAQRAQEETLGFHSQREGNMNNDYSQGIQSTKTECDKDANAIDQAIQRDRRLTELFMGSS